ncbi:hypothetical protein ACEUBT_08215 [Aeromonas bivalvium]|uniref:hypothetical protein n=1 Tax=Aeromonas bivalvium TaxID=440079 RepID=UPI0038D15AC4
MAFPVKWYSSAMQGAPSLGDITEGALAALLKAVLVTGFGNLTVNSLSWDAALGWAVATIDGGHSYLKDSVIAISGASPSGYNGEHRVMKVSATQVWFALDGGDPGIAASGTITIKIPGLGWVITHESANGQQFIVRSPEPVDGYPVSLRIDNTAFSGWTNGSYIQYLAKVALVEDVVDLTTYTQILEQYWPATGRYSDKRWDLIGDNLLFYFIPAYGGRNVQSLYLFGYINSVRPGDRYHAVLIHAPTTPNQSNIHWGLPANFSTNNVYTNAMLHDSTTHRWLARPYHQLFGTIGWKTLGLFSRIGTGLPIPNPADNGFYLAKDPTMVMESTGSVLRGYLPGLINPYSDIVAYANQNFVDLPAMNGRAIRFVRPTYSHESYSGAYTTLVGFDITGPWR